MTDRSVWLRDAEYWRPISQNVITGVILGSLAYFAAVFGGYVETPSRGFEVIFLGIFPIATIIGSLLSSYLAYGLYRSGDLIRRDFIMTVYMDVWGSIFLGLIAFQTFSEKTILF